MKKLVFILVISSMFSTVYGMQQMTPENLLAQGQKLAQAGDLKTALRYFEQVTQQNTNVPIKYEAWGHIGEIYKKQGQLKNANDAFLEATDEAANPDTRARAYIELGKLHFKEEDYGNYYLEQVILHNYNPVLQAEALVLLGLQALQFNYFNAAENYFKKAAEQNVYPKMKARAIVELARLYIKQRKFKEAHFYLNRIIHNPWIAKFEPRVQAQAQAKLNALNRREEAASTMLELSERPKKQATKTKGAKRERAEDGSTEEEVVRQVVELKKGKPGTLELPEPMEIDEE